MVEKRYWSYRDLFQLNTDIDTLKENISKLYGIRDFVVKAHTNNFAHYNEVMDDIDSMVHEMETLKRELMEEKTRRVTGE